MGNRNRPRRRRANARIGGPRTSWGPEGREKREWGMEEEDGSEGTDLSIEETQWAREGRGARNERGTAETRNRVRDGHRGDFERATGDEKSGERFGWRTTRLAPFEDKNSGTREDKEGGRTRDKVGGAHQDEERTREGNGGPTEMKRNRRVGVRSEMGGVGEQCKAQWLERTDYRSAQVTSGRGRGEGRGGRRLGPKVRQLGRPDGMEGEGNRTGRGSEGT